MFWEWYYLFIWRKYEAELTIKWDRRFIKNKPDWTHQTQSRWGTRFKWDSFSGQNVHKQGKLSQAFSFIFYTLRKTSHNTQINLWHLKKEKKPYFCWKSIAHHVVFRIIIYDMAVDVRPIIPEITRKSIISLEPNDQNHNNIEHFIGFAGHFNPKLFNP